MIVPIILSGGAGTRLWPASTDDAPKQFLPLVGPRTLFQEALDRVADRSRFGAPIVVGSERHAQLCEEALRAGDADARVILEPCARNTAAAIALAAQVAQSLHGKDCLLLVAPSDHVIEDVPAFHAAIRAGEPAAGSGLMVTFGIEPEGPETGYGYIEMGDELTVAPGARSVARFVEKPAIEAAEAMVAAGHYLWNAGIFLFRADIFLRELETHAPAIARQARLAVDGAAHRDRTILPDADAMQACESESIDYAVMEPSKAIAVVPMSPGWSDLGSWDALAALASETPFVGDVTAVECAGSYIRTDGVQIAALGVRDLIVVASGNRLLILPKGRSQEVKRLLSAVGAR